MTDQTSTTAPPYRLLVGAEGVAELEGVDWIRPLDAPGDLERFRDDLGISDRRLRETMLDPTGRPYFLCEVSADAPAAALERARRNVRVVRLLG